MLLFDALLTAIGTLLPLLVGLSPQTWCNSG